MFFKWILLQTSKVKKKVLCGNSQNHFLFLIFQKTGWILNDICGKFKFGEIFEALKHLMTGWSVTTIFARKPYKCLKIGHLLRTISSFLQYRKISQELWRSFYFFPTSNIFLDSNLSQNSFKIIEIILSKYLKSNQFEYQYNLKKKTIGKGD